MNSLSFDKHLHSSFLYRVEDGSLKLVVKNEGVNKRWGQHGEEDEEETKEAGASSSSGGVW